MTAHGLVTLTEVDGQLALTSPYNDALAARARELGGKWHADTRTWRFDPRDEVRVRRLTDEIYGSAGDDDPDDVATVRVHAKAKWEDPARVYVAGRIVAERRGRDTSVWLADGVVLVEGKFTSSGGSMRNPAIGDGDAILEVRDIPRAAALATGLEIVDQDRADLLRAERDRLAERIRKLDEELAAL